MPRLEIEDVRDGAPTAGPIRAFAVDAPQAGAVSLADGFELAGWVLGSEAPATGVEIVSETEVIVHVPHSATGTIWPSATPTRLATRARRARAGGDG